MRHRTALISAGSIAAVVFAGAIAVGANLGILTVADSSPVGQLTTATVSQVSPAEPTQSYAAGTPACAAKKQRATQAYVIKKAGNVRVAFSKKAVRFVDAGARKGWTWKLAQTGDRKLTVTFSHGSDTYTFEAMVGKHGKLTAQVDHPVTKVLPSSGGGSTTWASAPAAASNAASPAYSGEGQGGGDGGYHSGGEQDD
jgi:hypothetical protein